MKYVTEGPKKSIQKSLATYQHKTVLIHKLSLTTD